MNKLLLAACILMSVFLFSCAKNDIVVYADSDNDLVALLEVTGQNPQRYETVEKALEEAPTNGTLLVLARGYPQEKTVLPADFYQKASKKNLKVYLEYPDRLPSGETGAIKNTKKERFVVSSPFFGKGLNEMDILDAGLYSYIEIADREAHLKGANVAGFKSAVYGLEDTPNHPILFNEGKVLVATTKLSDFNKSRYAPLDSCKNALEGILSHVSVPIEPGTLDWTPLVRPSYSAEAELPEETYKKAVERGADWYVKARLLIHPDWQEEWLAVDTLNLPVGPPMGTDKPSGDGSLGIMEGHYSYIHPNGSQPYRYWLRADCVSEAAMTFAMSDAIQEKEGNVTYARNLMDFLFNSDTFKTPTSKDPKMSSYGLVGWAGTRPYIYYGDDNARVLLGAILASQTLGDSKWDRQILELILANFRTSGKKGFRSNRLSGTDVDQKTWQTLMQGELENPAPHFESWLWANYLWLYDKTGYKPLLDKAKKAIGITMDNYPDNWIWTNGIQQERARIILPLAWLLRVEDTEQHRKWLRTVCDDLLEYQVASGALREALGEGSKGKYGAPTSNARYGHNEAPVIHTNGDPLADMLYTSNFAFFALNEAAQVTQDPKYLKAVDKLADFFRAHTKQLIGSARFGRLLVPGL